MLKDKPILTIIIGLLIVFGAIWLISLQKINKVPITEDVAFSEDYVVSPDTRLVLSDGVTLTFEKSLIVNGEIEGAGAFQLVTLGDVTFNEASKVIANGDVQIVGSPEEFLKTEDDIQKLFDETANDSGGQPRVGPILPSDNEIISDDKTTDNTSEEVTKSNGIDATSLIANTAYAQGDEEIPDIVRTFSGKMNFKNKDPRKDPNFDPKKRPRIVIMSFKTGKVQLNLKNFTLTGPDAPDGASDEGASCNAKGEKGQDALRLSATAWGIDINNFTLTMGNGGNGGNAETIKDCDKGVAEGGKGGDSGNIKMIASNNLKISGAFNINPGKAGNGGNAKAFGKDGAPSEKGGDADATGGDGSDNKKKLAIMGTVGGSSNISIGTLFGGNGGNADALPGKGGDGIGCSAVGGAGGIATSNGGKGGDASMNLTTSGAGRAPKAQDIGGNGGNTNSVGGAGGNGGSCDSTGPGGNGGVGGDGTVAKAGTAGAGTTSSGTIGTRNSLGGNGGNGGDGCAEGKGASGGAGDIVGVNGADGKNLCVAKKDSTAVSVGKDNESTEKAVLSPVLEKVIPKKKTIDAIRYGTSYIPVAQLQKESGETGPNACDAEHWHALGENDWTVTTSAGEKIYDPGPPCGFGKTADVPIMQIEI